MPLTSHTPRGPVGSVLPQENLASGGGVAYSGSSRTLGSPSHRRPDLQCYVDGRQLWRWATALNFVKIRILKTVHAPSGLGLVYGVCLLPTQHKARGDHPFTLFFADHIRLRGIYDGHRLGNRVLLAIRFDCFRKLHLLFGRTVFPGYLVGVPSAEVKFSTQCACLGAIEKVPLSWLPPT